MRIRDAMTFCSEEFAKLPVTTQFHGLQMFLGPLVQSQRPDKAYVNTIASVLAGTVNAQENA